MALTCRMCGETGREVLELTPTPLANSFAEYPDADAARHPLGLWQCFGCGHVQLAHRPAIDWVDYRYSTPPGLLPHLRHAAASLRNRYATAHSVIEIGSNNGLNLTVLKEHGFDAIGVDPNARIGIREPFTEDLARKMKPVDLILANNVMAHVDDLHEVLRGVDYLLKDDGAFVFEVQYLPAMMASGAFDMIYHEHRDYHTLGPWPRLLQRYGLIVKDWERLATHKGSVRVYCERPGIPCLLPIELLDWRLFKHRIAAEREAVRAQVAAAKRPVVVVGAAAKATTLLHHFGLTESIDYAVDETPQKQGRYIPGTSIQIHPPSVLHEDPEATMLVTAWNYADLIRAQFPDKPAIVPFETKEGVLCR